MATEWDVQLVELFGGIPGGSINQLDRYALPLIAIDILFKEYGIDFVSLSLSLGVVNRRTMKWMHGQEQSLFLPEGDYLYRIGYVAILTEQVFGNEVKATLCLSKNKAVFDGMNAYQAAATKPGCIAVVEALEQIRLGVYA